jgi:hypothetical protein
MLLSWNGLQVQLAPDAALEHDGDTCFLYAYFRRSPALATDGVRALMALTGGLRKRGGPGANRIIVLDCFKDAFYESSDFQTGENWITNRISAVMGGYADAFKNQRTASTPYAVTLPDSFHSSAPLAIFYDDKTGLSDGQLTFRLH